MKIQYSIRLKESLLNDLKGIADARDRTTTDIIEKVLTDYVKMQSVKEKEIEGGIPVYDDEGGVIALVQYNNNLDHWNGSNWTSGSTGRHKGLTQLEDGRFVLIFGTDWQGERDEAIIIDEDRAVEEILKSRDMELFKLFPDLIPVMEKGLLKEKQ